MDLKNQLQFLGIQNTAEMMDVFKRSFCRRIGDNIGTRSVRRPLMIPGLGMFTFLMRSVMIRHAQAQKYTGTDTTLMSLPPKVRLVLTRLFCLLVQRLSHSLTFECFLQQTERIVMVKFSDEEKQVYSAMENKARTYYEKLQSSEWSNWQ